MSFARRGVQVQPDHIVLTASTSEAYSLLFKLLCDPGDVVLAPRPSYPLIEHLTELDAVSLEHYSLEFHGRWTDRYRWPAGNAVDAARETNTGDHHDQPEQSDRLGGKHCRAARIGIART